MTPLETELHNAMVTTFAALGFEHVETRQPLNDDGLEFEFQSSRTDFIVVFTCSSFDILYARDLAVYADLKAKIELLLLPENI